MFENVPKKIKIVEVGPRDGLQNEKSILSIQDKLEYIRLLSLSGIKTIEATSFVRADKIPQMADAGLLFNEIKKLENYDEIDFPCLVPNIKGFNLASEVGVKEISLFSATSNEFTKKNINCTVDESFARMKEVAQEAKSNNLRIRGYISTSFGCPYAGDMSVGDLISVVQKFLDLGVYEISIGDTIGVATPSQVDKYLTEVLKVIDISKVAMHFHDTRGMALSNILVSLEKGITSYDSSSGGLGGCPYAKGSTGNIATEDVLYLVNSLGIETGVDLDKVVEASRFILDKVQKVSPSKFYQTLVNK
jgi:hydroxymethylglutaryl-CoA lyase